MFRMLLLGVAWLMAWLLLRGRLSAQSNVSKIKVSVGAGRAYGLKGQRLYLVRRTRSYPNFVRGNNGLGFSGHVDHHSKQNQLTRTAYVH